jgi:hypothetical protein
MHDTNQGSSREVRHELAAVVYVPLGATTQNTGLRVPPGSWKAARRWHSSDGLVAVGGVR